MTATSNTTTTAKQLSDGSTSGNTLGQSATDKIAFYGTTPIVQPSEAGLTELSTGTTGDDLVTAINAATAVLKNLGLASS